MTGGIAGCGETLCNFNSHAHVERDEHGHAKKGGKGNFNSHAHVERDINNGSGTFKVDEFQLTRSRGA